MIEAVLFIKRHEVRVQNFIFLEWLFEIGVESAWFFLKHMFKYVNHILKVVERKMLIILQNVAEKLRQIERIH